MEFVTDTGERFFIGISIFLIALMLSFIIPINDKVVYLYNINKTQEVSGSLLSISTNNIVCFWEKRGSLVISDDIKLADADIFEDENDEPYAIIKYNLFGEPIEGEFHIPEGTLQNTYDLQ